VLAPVRSPKFFIMHGITFRLLVSHLYTPI
jgi:hypothetical protein